MKGAWQRIAVVTVVLAGVVACADKEPSVAMQEGRTIKPKANDTVTVTANCTTPNQVDVAVNNWVVDVKKSGEVNFLLTSTSSPAPDVTVSQKKTGNWPFADTTAIKPGKGDGNGRNKGKAKAEIGKYQYNLTVVCGTQTVVIDPDIFVN